MYLKEFREKTGLSQKDFAEKLKLTQVTIARYETEKMNPTTTVIQKYIDVFQANPYFLFMGKGPMLLSQQEAINIRDEIEKRQKEIEELKETLRQKI
jgi:transcriptional regulator with XRE-family HTH domain